MQKGRVYFSYNFSKVKMFIEAWHWQHMLNFTRTMKRFCAIINQRVKKEAQGGLMCLESGLFINEKLIINTFIPVQIWEHKLPSIFILK